MERLMKEIRRRTRVVGAFPDRKSALMLVAARLRHVASTKWGEKSYLQMNHLAEALQRGGIEAGAHCNSSLSAQNHRQSAAPSLLRAPRFAHQLHRHQSIFAYHL